MRQNNTEETIIMQEGTRTFQDGVDLDGFRMANWKSVTISTQPPNVFGFGIVLASEVSGFYSLIPFAVRSLPPCRFSPFNKCFFAFQQVNSGQQFSIRRKTELCSALQCNKEQIRQIYQPIKLNRTVKGDKTIACSSCEEFITVHLFCLIRTLLETLDSEMSKASGDDNR